MFGALTYGAGPSDTIKLIAGSNPPTPIGGQAQNPVAVQVLTPDGVTPVAGASVFFTSSPGASLSSCSGAASCTVLTDQSGYASTYVTVLSPGAVAIIAQLAPASYNPPKTVQATINGVSNGASGPDIALAPQQAWIAQGATVSLPLTARALQNGAPLAGITVTFRIENGSGALNPSSAVTGANGYATSTLQLGPMAADIEVSACLEPGDKPCANFNAIAVPGGALLVQPVAGTLQIALLGQNFQPVTARVTDSAGDPVLGANVTFQWLVARAPQNLPIVWIGDTGISTNPMPVILSSLQSIVSTGVNGLVTIQPSTGGVQGAVVMLGSATAGSSSLQFELQSLPPVSAAQGATESGSRSALVVHRKLEP
jgi:hypothetical protein